MTIDAQRAGPIGGGDSLDEDDQPRALWERAIGWAVVALCTWLVFCIIDPAHSGA